MMEHLESLLQWYCDRTKVISVTMFSKYITEYLTRGLFTSALQLRDTRIALFGHKRDQLFYSGSSYPHNYVEVVSWDN